MRVPPREGRRRLEVPMRLYAKLILVIAACGALHLAVLDPATGRDAWLGIRWTVVEQFGSTAARDRLCEEVRERHREELHRLFADATSPGGSWQPEAAQHELSP